MTTTTLKTSPFPSQAEEINVRVPCSRAPYKSPFWKAGQPQSARRDESGYCSAQVRRGERLRREPRACAAGRAAAAAGADKGLQVSSPPGSRELCFRALHHLRTTTHLVMHEMEIPRSSSPPAHVVGVSVAGRSWGVSFPPAPSPAGQSKAFIAHLPASFSWTSRQSSGHLSTPTAQVCISI